ncbi:tRNA methyltransferase [Punctularia strigosozonata HHB-11173 SS5]|uniref:tRNA methyltransferase n=1 Tax=Punctularia strigosozonata (strain HHB-11173) TaxID=741275 RepID=UPI00044162B2|nr:tRNA methyltransferase [Punctularia strigosozonata HHB-11173 SS5]EIN13219.1 tRNA methyltransferase [Punctularia strigosozonata HHB-11173 SS5]
MAAAPTSPVAATTQKAGSRSLPGYSDLQPPEKRPRLDSEDVAMDGGRELEVDPVDSKGLPATVTGGLVEKNDAVARKRTANQRRKLEKARRKLPEPGTAEDANWLEVVDLLGKEAVDEAFVQKREWDQIYDTPAEVEVVIEALSSSGHGLARAPGKPPWAIIVPFCLPGETVRAKVYKNQRLHSLAELIEIVIPNPGLRDDSRIQCRYFGKCGGCQYQMLSYEKQLEFKRDVVVKAYKNYSELPPSVLPEIGATFASPKQYGYRTKLTPHFECAPKEAWRNSGFLKSGGFAPNEKPDWLHIGFNEAGSSRVMDIEECPIGTPAINEAYGQIRSKVIQNIWSYSKGVSLLFRESLPVSSTTASLDIRASRSPSPEPQSENVHVVTDNKAIVRERVGSKLFNYMANEFFQNNNSILEGLTSYVRSAILAPSAFDPSLRPTHLVDAYCGAGLFAITLADEFEHVAGIEISQHSIRYALHNRALNRIQASKVEFVSDDAVRIFSCVKAFPRERTAVVIDPPRKGCSTDFVDQLVGFLPATIAYVSCNVHTQARDVGMILRETEKRAEGKRYVIESLRGFDLFPQTAHVEGVAILRLVDAPAP